MRLKQFTAAYHRIVSQVASKIEKDPNYQLIIPLQKKPNTAKMIPPIVGEPMDRKSAMAKDQ